MRLTTATLIIALCTLSLPVLADSPLVNLLIDEEEMDLKKDIKSGKIQDTSKNANNTTYGRTINLSPEAKDVFLRHQDLLTNMPPKIREELKSYMEQRTAIFNKLSPEAKEVLNKRRESLKNISLAAKEELKKHNNNTHNTQ